MAPSDPCLAWIHRRWSVDPRWCELGHDSFRWWPSRYPQNVQARPIPHSDLMRLRATTTLVTALPDAARARETLSALNAGSCGWVAHLTHGGTTLTLNSALTISRQDLAGLTLFADSAIVQAIVADQIGPVLAETLGGVPATNPHPRRGIRATPHGALELLTQRWRRPQFVLAPPWLSEPVFDAIAARLSTRSRQWSGPDILQSPPARAGDLFTLPLHQGTTMVAGFSSHPDIGHTLTLNLVIDSQLTEGDAQRLTDDLNRQASTDPERCGLGAWWSREGQPCWSTYLQEGFTSLLSQQESARGEQIADLMWESANSALNHYLAHPPPAGECSPVRPWGGLHQEGRYPLTLYPNRQDSRDAMALHLRENPGSVLEVDLTDLGPTPEIGLGLWGIANPAGPTLTSIGLIRTRYGWLFAEWLRNPHGPSTRVHALLQAADDDTIAAACQNILVGGYSDPQNAIVPYLLPEFVFPPPPNSPGRHTRDALLKIATELCDADEMFAETLALQRYASDPWGRLLRTESETSGGAPLDRGESVADRWWETVTAPVHLAASTAFVIDVWDRTLQILHTLSEGGDPR